MYLIKSALYSFLECYSFLSVYSIDIYEKLIIEKEFHVLTSVTRFMVRFGSKYANMSGMQYIGGMPNRIAIRGNGSLQSILEVFALSMLVLFMYMRI